MVADTAIAYVPRAGAFAAEDIAAAAADLRALGDLRIVAVTRDRLRPRDGLIDALERLAAGEAETLATHRLGALAGSLPELVALLDWLAAGDLSLVALDVGLDTRTRAGAKTVALLREIAGWQHEPQAGRGGRGRPGLALKAPELGERIAAMRERGLSLQAIADSLNDDGVPTPRGGALWRPSSVQAALGYRRPRPPVPGAPPPPPPPHRAAGSTGPPAHGRPARVAHTRGRPPR